MTSIGPVQFIALGFPEDANYSGQIIAEIEKIEASGSLRVLDVLFVRKDPDTGELLTMDIQGDELKTLAGNLTLGVSRREIEGVGAELAPGQGRACSWSNTCGRSSWRTRSSRPAAGSLPRVTSGPKTCSRSSRSWPQVSAAAPAQLALRNNRLPVRAYVSWPTPGLPGGRSTQRKPMWQVEVSIVSRWRAAGR